MSSSNDFKDFVLECLKACDTPFNFNAKKMFGEYCIYINSNSAFLICNNTLYTKKLPCLEELLRENELGFPFPKAKQWYILDVENLELLNKIIWILSDFYKEKKCKE
ncbi:hypothetical protein JG677_00330 [Campylobacter sp. TTU-622]|uniref:hypothetical protein n=1 Tax=unclassified Campylobacter TaxID=2593542 RepID=UPI0019084B2C|nr:MULTISPECIES: hypothetical protein [unclassified Campylobacter]MBK1972520.1 hypothetical protein [Campylobacter sp. TTU-622]MBK1991046.1 hypothetical protein [Campylobacter sp. 2018MI34]